MLAGKLQDICSTVDFTDTWIKTRWFIYYTYRAFIGFFNCKAFNCNFLNSRKALKLVLVKWRRNILGEAVFTAYNWPMSCRPVTSGAPSQTTSSAFPPEKWSTILLAVDSFVMSPWNSNQMIIWWSGTDVLNIGPITFNKNAYSNSMYCKHSTDMWQNASTIHDAELSSKLF